MCLCLQMPVTGAWRVEQRKVKAGGHAREMRKTRSCKIDQKDCGRGWQAGHGLTDLNLQGSQLPEV